MSLMKSQFWNFLEQENGMDNCKNEVHLQQNYGLYGIQSSSNASDTCFRTDCVLVNCSDAERFSVTELN